MNEALFGGAVSWFPQQYAELAFMLKGGLSVAATVILVIHMLYTWDDVHTWGRRLRYFALLGASSLIAFASAEQDAEESLVSYRHLGALLVAVVILLAGVVSIREDFRRRHP